MRNYYFRLFGIIGLGVKILSSFAQAEELSFHSIKPNWGIQLGYSPNPIGFVVPSYPGLNPKMVGGSFSFEFQPALLQDYGILGIGFEAAIYPNIGYKVAAKCLSFFGLGGQIRYQFRYFKEQFLVPVLGYKLQSLRYSFMGLPKEGRVLFQGPIFGLWFLLNSIDESSATQLYLNIGLARSYLIGEYQILFSENEQVTFKSKAYFMGIRFEF